MPRKGFNADERAQEREQGPIVIGGVTYHARRLTNKRLREVRALSRAGTRAAREAAERSEEYREAYDEAIERGVGADGEPLKGEELRKYARRLALDAGNGSDEADAANTQSLREQLPLLLVDDSMMPPSDEAVARHIEEDLDTRDVGDLMTYLLGTPEEDPTPSAGS